MFHDLKILCIKCMSCVSLSLTALFPYVAFGVFDEEDKSGRRFPPSWFNPSPVSPVAKERHHQGMVHICGNFRDISPRLLILYPLRHPMAYFLYSAISRDVRYKLELVVRDSYIDI